MYVPAVFAESRPEVLHAFMRENSFATVVTGGSEGLVASHVPVLLLGDRGEHGALQFHLAKPNPQGAVLAAGTDTLVMFHGPHAYVSPTWYETTERVPTWNYVAVHAYGRARVLSDGELEEHLRVLGSAYEEPGGWSVGRLPGEVGEKLRRAIVGFEVGIERIEGKWKLGQNRLAADVRGAIAGLRARGDAESARVARLMEEAAGKAR